MVESQRIDHALELLRSGDVVAIPTETVYGLAADATRSDSVRKIFDLKGRPSTNPLIAHVASIEVAGRFAHLDERARKVFQRFSPGPISIVLPKIVAAGSICPEATAGLPSVAIRIPNHPVTLELLRRFDGALAAPSANRSNHVSPTTAEHVRNEFGDQVFILDGGPCAVGIESTVLDLTTDRARILRPGQITKPMIEALIGEVEISIRNLHPSEASMSPGLQERHYAPRTRACRFDRSQIHEIQERISKLRTAIVSFGEYGIGEFDLSRSPDRAAHDFYEMLRRIDGMNYDLILVENPPPGSEWEGLRDRIRRATRSIDELPI